MEDFTYVDIFEHNGLEFLLVIVFLFVLIGFWRYIRGSDSDEITGKE